MERQSFLRNHVDTLAIMGVNLAIAAILIGMWTANTARIDAANARTDQLFNTWQQETKDFHARLCTIEERNRK